ncbi:Zn-dependent exopeptidase [Cylindrobasidium torrendii FP15055 ss-10]|uniref:Zn-dependent exopeptidase n=1 Tax=Cylindrobasidium torrendii FP15055 ss-10 TaxID=1314674 RepID=A0A0D7BI39_9AGAR|nr:Zn-dependent exopeptidase [Cylindrobasidium torrendii FP15055 ss-10]
MAVSHTEKLSGVLPSHSVPTRQAKRSSSAKFIFLGILLATVLGYKAFVALSASSAKPTKEEWETLFLSVPDPEHARETSIRFSKDAHLAGSTQDFADARYIMELFRTELDIPTPKEEPIYNAGTPKSRANTIKLTMPFTSSKPTAWIDTYYPVMDTPAERTLELIDSDGYSLWTADLEEDGDPADEDAARARTAVPAWHGMSFDGEAEGELIYVNYGTQEDYRELLAAGVDFTGKIVIARYGHIFRGLKAYGAQELGAAGILIYSDPRDDGFVTVENGYSTYPNGPARNPDSVQRGSVMLLSKYPGDPTTPGYPAYENANRTSAENIPKIPSLPISWANAQRLLEEIGGNDKLTGRSSQTKVKLVNHVDRKVTPIWNTMAAIPGHVRDQVLLVGAHRDAWVLGAADPVSGTVSLVEIVKAFGELLRTGWKPLRTVVFASWDAEEQGLVGSVEYGEDFAEWIQEHLVAYLNVDVSSSGSSWNAGGSPSLAHLIKQTALDVPHPTNPGKSLWDARNDEGPFKPDSATEEQVADAAALEWYASQKAAKASRGTGVTPLGSGSDYTVFLQRLGVASTDQGFGGTPYDAPYHYHSIYDSYRWQDLYADPGFFHHVAVAKHLGLMALRITDATILPLNTTQYAYELEEYLDTVQSLADELQSSWSLDLTGLRASIRTLQVASNALDAEKEDAERTFKDLLGKLPSFPPGREPKFAHHKSCMHGSAMLSKISAWVKSLFGVYTPEVSWEDAMQWPTYKEVLEQENAEKDLPLPSPPKIPGLPPIWEFIKAQRRVIKANKLLMSFERGFISEGGIKEREWYKHLGVAPGKWLGYGATTLPALTEAITFENDKDLAEYEAKRLIGLIDALTDIIMPDE